MDSIKLNAMDVLLNPVANAHQSSSTTTLCLALLSRAGTDQASDVRSWLRLRRASDQRLLSFIGSSAWPRLVASQTRYSSRTPDANLALLLDRLLGRIFTSPSGARVLPDKEQKLKVALVAVGIRLIQSLVIEGRDSIMVSAPALALDLGTTRVTAHKLLRDLVDQGYLNRVSTHPGSASRFRIPALTRAERKTLNQMDESAVETLRDSLLHDGLLTQVIHPAFSYTESTHKPWLMAVSMLAGTSPESVGLRRRQDVPQLRALVAEMGLLEPGLDQALSDWAELLGGDVKHREAMEQRAFEIELRVGELNLAKDASAKAKAGVASLADSLGGMPSGKTPLPYLEAWAAKMNELVASNLADAPASDKLAPAIAKELDRRAERLAWDAECRKLLFAA